MNGTDKVAQTSLSLPATSICNCSDSTTHGPAIRNRGRLSPTSKPQSFTTGSGDELRWGTHPLGSYVAVALQGCAHEGDEQRVTAPRIGGELRMELATEEPGVVGELDGLAQVPGFF